MKYRAGQRPPSLVFPSSMRISETMRLSDRGDPVLGQWEAHEHQIVIRRDTLQDLASYVGTLLHEIGHVLSGTTDATLDFENELSRLLGIQRPKPRDK
jgi:hypothetical protein